MPESSQVPWEDLHHMWVELQRNANNPTRSQREFFWQWLTEETQPSRWFHICQQALSSTDGFTLPALRSTTASTLQAFGGRAAPAYSMIEAHIQCAELAPTLPPTAPMPSPFQALADSLRMPCGFFYDLARQLLQCPQEPVYTFTTPILLVHTRTHEGLVADLRLELLAHGAGQCWPAPALAFVPRDPAFREAESAAKTYLEHIRVWRKSHDVRWSIQCPDDVPLPRLEGASLGGALAIGCMALWDWVAADAERSEMPPSLLPLARGLPLPGTAVTAALDGDGNLHRVGDIKQKLQAASEHAFIQRVLVATEQPLPSAFKQDRRRPARYVATAGRRTSPLEVWRVRTVPEALAVLAVLYDARRQAFLEAIYTGTLQSPVAYDTPQHRVQAQLRRYPGDTDLVWDIAEASRRGDICVSAPIHAGSPFLALTGQGRQRLSLLTRCNAQLWVLLGRDVGLPVGSLLLAIGAYSVVDQAFYVAVIVPYFTGVLLGVVGVACVALVPSSVLVRCLRRSRVVARCYGAILAAGAWRIGKPLCLLMVIESLPYGVLYLVCAMINAFVWHWRVWTLGLMAIGVGGVSSVVRLGAWITGQRSLALHTVLLLVLWALCFAIALLPSEVFAYYGHRSLVQCFVGMILVRDLVGWLSALWAGLRQKRVRLPSS